MSNKKRTVILGTAWTTLSTIVMAMVQILRLSVLARYLDKSDFGIVAILTLILGLTNTFGDLGFATAVMHKKEISTKEFSSLYWIQMLLFVVIYILVSLLSPTVAKFYSDEALIYLLPIVMLDLPFKGLGRLYEVLLQKNYCFKIMSIRNIVCSILSLILAIYLAHMGYGVYSMILSTLFNTITLNLWNFIVGYRYMPLTISCSIREVINLVKIGVYQTGSQILDYISTKIDIIILGKLLGTEQLGIYNLAKELIVKALEVLNGIANKVALPFFASMQHSSQLLRINYSRLISLLSIINIPICAFMGAYSKPIVMLFYGETYLDVAPLMTILSIWGMFVIIGNPVGNIVISTGRTDLSFRYTIYRLLLFIPITYILSSISLNALSLGQIILAFIGGVLSWYMLLYKTIKLKLINYLKSFYKVMCFSIITVVVFYRSINNYKSFSEDWQLVVCSIAIFIALYLICMYVFNRKQLMDLYSIIRN